MSTVDLNNLGPNYDVNIATSERDDERAHRHSLEMADARLKRTKEYVRFFVTLAGIMLFCGYAVVRLAEPESSSEEKKWAMAALTAVVSASVGYLLPRA